MPDERAPKRAHALTEKAKHQNSNAVLALQLATVLKRCCEYSRNAKELRAVSKGAKAPLRTAACGTPKKFRWKLRWKTCVPGTIKCSRRSC